MNSLLIELQTEELPPKSLKKLCHAFAQGIFDGLKAEKFLSASSKLTVYGAPRRMAVHITEVLPQSPDLPFKQRLVPVRIGLDAQGKPTQALEKKMHALGIDKPVAELKREGEGKNELFVYEGIKKGEPLSAGVQRALDESVKNLPIARVMNYQLADGVTTVQFVRPVEHLSVLYGNDVVEGVEKFGLKSGRTTRGHRFHTTGTIDIVSADGYAEQMKTQGKVVANYEERRAQVCALLDEAAKKEGGKLIEPESLVDETNSMTEWPVVYVSEFEKKFLAVPEECLILTMQTNQKYFPMRDASGKLMNKFALVSQIVAKDGGKAIVAGNARVVRARLADAEFFYRTDCQDKLESRVEGLKHVVYHNKLGSQFERTQRVQVIARSIAEKIGANAEEAARAALLAKADLRTLMVGEFPELQGIMGDYYARNDGESADVALAIREHYQPRFAGDALPSMPVSTAVAMADKLETLAGMFGIGQQPTGEKDPYALRRHALGILRMMIEKQLPLGLDDLVQLAFAVEKSVPGVKDEGKALIDFFFDRLRVMMRDAGYSAQEVDAVLALRLPRVADLPQRLAAVRRFQTLAEAESLSAANKRIGNILKKAEGSVLETVNESLFAEPAEKALFAALQGSEPQAEKLYGEGKYTEMLASLATIKPAVDAFFNDVMVNVEDPAVRGNRLALLKRLYALMNRVAVLSRLAK